MFQEIEAYETLDERLDKRQCLSNSDSPTTTMLTNGEMTTVYEESRVYLNHQHASEELQRKGEREREKETEKKGEREKKGDNATLGEGHSGLSSVTPSSSACLLSLLPQNAPASLVQLLEQQQSATRHASSLSTMPTLAHGHGKYLPSLPPLFTSSYASSMSGNSGGPSLQSQLSSILSALKAYTPYSLPFVRPVNRREVPDYYTVIRHPMDLQSMRSKLKAQQYTTVAQVRIDLQLILDNCFTYNTREEGNIYRVYAKALFDKGMELLDSIDEPVAEVKKEKDTEGRSHVKESTASPAAPASQPGLALDTKCKEGDLPAPSSSPTTPLTSAEQEDRPIDWLLRMWHRFDTNASRYPSPHLPEQSNGPSSFSSVEALLSFLHHRQLTYAVDQSTCSCPELVFAACLPHCASQLEPLSRAEPDGKLRVPYLAAAVAAVSPSPLFSSSLELMLSVIERLRRIRTYRLCILEQQPVPSSLACPLSTAFVFPGLNNLLNVIQVLLAFLGFEGLEHRAGYTFCQTVERYLTGLVSSLKYTSPATASTTVGTIRMPDCHALFRQGNMTPSQGLSYLLWLRHKYPMKLKEIEHRFHQQSALRDTAVMEDRLDEPLESELKDPSLLTGQLTSASAIYDSLELDWLGLKELGLLNEPTNGKVTHEIEPKETEIEMDVDHDMGMDFEAEVDLELQREESSSQENETHSSQNHTLAKSTKSTLGQGDMYTVVPHGPFQPLPMAASSSSPSSTPTPATAANGKPFTAMAAMEHAPITRSVIESSACLPLLRPFYLDLLEKSHGMDHIDENKFRVWTERPVDHAVREPIP